MTGVQKVIRYKCIYISKMRKKVERSLGSTRINFESEN